MATTCCAAGPDPDVLHGGAKGDVIWAGAGRDIVYGGTGNDMIRSGGDSTRAAAIAAPAGMSRTSVAETSPIAGASASSAIASPDPIGRP